MAAKKPGKKMGRPRKNVDWESVAEMCHIHCTEEEIASLCKCSIDTLQRRCFEETGLTFAQFSRQNRAGGKQSLRRRQYTIANAGDKTMLIWLGKQWLGQKDQSRVETDAKVTIDKPLSEYTAEELDAAYVAAMNKEGKNESNTR